MSANYFTYYTAYDSRGNEIMNGNSGLTIDDDAASMDSIKSHCDFLVTDLKKANEEVERVVIKFITKL